MRSTWSIDKSTPFFSKRSRVSNLAMYITNNSIAKNPIMARGLSKIALFLLISTIHWGKLYLEFCQIAKEVSS